MFLPWRRRQFLKSEVSGLRLYLMAMETVKTGNDIERASNSSDSQEYSFKGMDSLYSAAADGDIEEFEQYSKCLDQILTPNGNTILHIHITARPGSGNMDFVRKIHKKCPHLLLKVNEKGETLLHMAARHGHFDVAKYLLEERKGIHYPNQYDDQELGITPTRGMLQMTSHEAKDTALHEAVVRHDNFEVVELLIKADRELPYDANTAGETPLYLAAERGYIDVLCLILDYCSSPADHGPYDRTALHVAVIRKDEAMVEILLQIGEKINKSKQDQHGWTPLHFASHLGYIEILNMLLLEDQSAAYKADNKGKTALHVAAGLGREDIMKKIILKCPGCCELVDKRGWNVLHFALESRNPKAVKLILKNPWLKNLINEKDENGNTPLLHAVSIGYYGMKHPELDMQVFNHRNHNAKDIILVNYTRESELMPDLLFWLEKHSKVRLGLRMVVSEIDNIGEGRDKGNMVRSKSEEDKGVEDEDEKMSSKSNYGKGKTRSTANFIAKAREFELVAATLIATVTFAAGFTVPGGFVADKGPDMGAAVLTRNTAFRVFVILNTVSMFLSSLAVFNNLSATFVTHVLHMRELFQQGRRLGQFLITYAMMAMIGAFLSGTFAVLHTDRNLAIIACVMPVVMFAFIRYSNKIQSMLLYCFRGKVRTTEDALNLGF